MKEQFISRETSLNMTKPSVLIVDDQIMMTHFLAYHFRKSYEVITKNDGFAALSWLEKCEAPDMIIADMDMPLLACFDFIQILKKDPSLTHVPILILSVKERSEDRIHCLQLGAEDCLTKPFNPEELDLKIRRILDVQHN